MTHLPKPLASTRDGGYDLFRRGATRWLVGTACVLLAVTPYGCRAPGAGSSPAVASGEALDSSTRPAESAPPARMGEQLESAGSPVTIRPAAPGEIAAVSFQVPGTPRDVWNFVNRAVQDTVFTFVTSRTFEYMVARSVRRGLTLRIDLVPQGDSTFIAVSGTRYTGPRDRPGFALASDEHWPSIRAGDPAISELAIEGNRIRTLTARARRAEAERATASVARGAPGPLYPLLETPVGEDSLVRVLSDGTLGYCRANTVRVGRHLDTLLIVDVVNRPEWCPLPAYSSDYAGNTYALRNPRTVAVGDTLSVCAVTGGARGYRFEAVAWYTNPSRCPRDASHRQRSEPNMVLLRRIE